MKPLTVIGFLGSTLDASKFGPTRWSKWRPTVGLTMHEDLRVDRLILLHGSTHRRLADYVIEDVSSVSPETLVERRVLDFRDPWDFEEVYGKLLDFARAEPFDPDAEDYLIHITTGTHVAQICLFLLTEARYLPGRLLQTQPDRGMPSPAGTWNTIDLDLSRYDSIATRFAVASAESTSFLKSGIRHAQCGLQPYDRRNRTRRVALARAVFADGPDRGWEKSARTPNLRIEASKAPGFRPVCRSELRDAEGRWRDVGAVRSPQGRFHRRGRRPPRPAPLSRQGHLVSRRNRRTRPRRAGDDPSRDRG